MNKYYALTTNGQTADIYIFGDITSWEWLESDVSSYTLSKELQGLDVDVINVHINSYGGEVAEGLAIYNMLKNHKAKVNTICDGFACSIAAVIFMAGDERIMNNASLLIVHNAWTHTAGDAKELRKTADDLDIITQATMEAFKAHVNISDDELKALLDAESWLSPQEALEKGFATSIKAVENSENPSQSVRQSIINKIINNQQDKQPAYQSTASIQPMQVVNVDDVINRLAEIMSADSLESKQTEQQEEPKQENKLLKLLDAIQKTKLIKSEVR